MTDTTALLNQLVSQTNTFINALEALRLISDRIGADSGLATALATQAQKTSRTDLVAADFDNLKIVIDLVGTLMAATNGGSVPVSINTGGTVKLGFYKVI